MSLPSRAYLGAARSGPKSGVHLTPCSCCFFVGNRDLSERKRRFVAGDRDDYPMLPRFLQ